MNVPTAGPDAGSDDGDVVTSTAEVWATVTQSAEGASETSSVSGVSTRLFFVPPRSGFLLMVSSSGLNLSWNTVKRATNPRIAWTRSRCRTATRSRSSSSLHDFSLPDDTNSFYHTTSSQPQLETDSFGHGLRRGVTTTRLDFLLDTFDRTLIDNFDGSQCDYQTYLD